MQFFLDAHGCAKNQVDAEILVGILKNRGWESSELPEHADLIIVNSCGFIESAKTESIEAVVTARKAYPKAKVLLAGCLAERYAEVFQDNLAEADAFFGNGDLSRLPEILDALFPASSASADSPRPVLKPAQRGVCGGSRPDLLSFPRSAYVKITEGCDNWCSFCAIPLIRGALRSRTIEEVVSECRELVSRGVYELNLIGQDLAAFGCGSGLESTGEPAADGQAVPSSGSDADPSNPSPLSLLLSALSALPGDFRVRFLYIHPDHFPRDILPVMAGDPRFLPYFDIPFQSGDDSLIQAMNRKGSVSGYEKLVQDIRAAFKASPYGTAVLRTTFLVGFPGETDEAHQNTARFLSSIRSLWSGCFTWSAEEGTRAADLKKKVPKKTAKARMEALQQIQTDITPKELQFFLGKKIEVLIEECIPDPPAEAEQADEDDGIPVSQTHLALGRAWFQAPEVDGSVVLQYEDASKGKDGAPVAPGSVVEALVIGVNGVDIEALAQ